MGYIAYTGAVHRDGRASRAWPRARSRSSPCATPSPVSRPPPTAPRRSWPAARSEDLRKRLETYRGSLALLRRLVPERNEVPNLLDDISTRSKIRGVTLSQVVPLPVEPGPAPFDTYKYNMSVIGHYDQIGQFLADVASLQRIIVPYDLVGRPPPTASCGQGTGRHHRFAAGGQVPGPDLRQVSQPGRRGQWHVTLVRARPPGAAGAGRLLQLDKRALTGTRRPRRPRRRLAALRARTDSLSKARRIADSLAEIRHAACVDSVRAELSKPVAVAKKTKSAKRKKAPAPPPEADRDSGPADLRTDGRCASRHAGRQSAATGRLERHRQAAAQGRQRFWRAPSGSGSPTRRRLLRLRLRNRLRLRRRSPPRQRRTVDSSRPTLAPRIRLRKQRTEMSRETFAYSGAARDPFNSLLNMAKNGPELADLELVGVYQNLRAPSGQRRGVPGEGRTASVTSCGPVTSSAARGWCRSVTRDAVFTIEDFGFERQETLSLRKQEDETP